MIANKAVPKIPSLLNDSTETRELSIVYGFVSLLIRNDYVVPVWQPVWRKFGESSASQELAMRGDTGFSLGRND
jgi:hypothetical protein